MTGWKNFIILFSLTILSACSLKDPESEMQKLASHYQAKEITNLHMLFEMGKLYYANPENSFIKQEYFNRMIISGYASWVLHYYKASPEKIKTNTDETLILFALNKGHHYELAGEFSRYFSDKNLVTLESIHATGARLDSLNRAIMNGPAPGLHARRGELFATMGAMELSNFDLNKSMQMDPCNKEALYQRSLILFDKENTGEIIRLLARCPQTAEDAEWREVFFQLAKDVEELNSSTDETRDKLFRLANLYVNNGFAEIALRKSDQLIRDNPGKPDYLALHAFVYYRLGNKSRALFYIDEAESLSGRSSRLRSLIEQMD
jgi:tetratricopeptide (TPR) repeat protein